MPRCQHKQLQEAEQPMQRSIHCIRQVAHPTSHETAHKQHLNRFTRFCTVHSRAQHTDHEACDITSAAIDRIHTMVRAIWPNEFDLSSHFNKTPTCDRQTDLEA